VKKLNAVLMLNACLGLLALSQAGAVTVPANPKPKVRLFILSGQSNMEKLDESRSFTPAIKKAFPGDEVIVVKYAVGATPIRLWCKGWKAPEGSDEFWTNDMEQQGSLYDKLIEKVQEAIKGKTPDTVSFVWMQGERDAKGCVSASYEASLRGLIRKVREDMKCDDVTVVIGRLSTHLMNDKHWEAIRAIQEKVATDDPRGAWVNTDGLNGPKNGVHYTEERVRGTRAPVCREDDRVVVTGGRTGGAGGGAAVAGWRTKSFGLCQKSAPRPEQAAALAALEWRFAAAATASAVDWKGLAEDAGALRRRTILSHPLLNFDDLLFVERDILVTSPGYRPTTGPGALLRRRAGDGPVLRA